MFWKKKEELIIQCSICEWNPDGGIYWTCSCGHRWNTFSTKGKCPKCKTQWEDTRCPGCGKSTPHKDWYKTKEEVALIEKSGDPVLRKKKKSLESKLISYGIKNYRVSHLPYLDHSKAIFQTPYDVGCRMIILFAISYLAHHLDERDEMMEWLKSERLWNKVSPKEKEFLITPLPDETTLMELSWNIEGALVLGWCLKKINTLPKLDDTNNAQAIEELEQNIPGLGDPVMLFLSNLEYRDRSEIYEERLINELTTTYFRDLMFNGRADTTNIDRSINFERHKTLNWLGSSYAAEDEVTGELWDDVDTST